VRVATYVTSVAGALTATACSDTDGYVLVWCSDEPTPGQVRAARISHTGQLGPAITVYDAKTDIWPIAAALTAQSLKVLVLRPISLALSRAAQGSRSWRLDLEERGPFLLAENVTEEIAHEVLGRPDQRAPAG
jgi:hypothetical protein